MLPRRYMYDNCFSLFMRKHQCNYCDFDRGGIFFFFVFLSDISSCTFSSYGWGTESERRHLGVSQGTVLFSSFHFMLEQIIAEETINSGSLNWMYFFFFFTFLNLFVVSSPQFYKNLSTSLDNVVWKTEDDMQETK